MMARAWNDFSAYPVDVVSGDTMWTLLVGTNVLIVLLLTISVFTGWLNYRKARIIVEKQDQQHLATNSRLDQLLMESKASAHAAGVKEERDRPA